MTKNGDRRARQPLITKEQADSIIENLAAVRSSMDDIQGRAESAERIMRSDWKTPISIIVAAVLVVLFLRPTPGPVPAPNEQSMGNNTLTVQTPINPERAALMKKPILTTSELSKLTGEHLDTIYDKLAGDDYKGTQLANKHWRIQNPFLAEKQPKHGRKSAESAKAGI